MSFYIHLKSRPFLVHFRFHRSCYYSYDSTPSNIRRCCDIATTSMSNLWIGELIQCDGGLGRSLGGGGLLNFAPAYGIFTAESVLFSLRRRRGMLTEVESSSSKAVDVGSWWTCFALTERSFRNLGAFLALFLRWKLSLFEIRWLGGTWAPNVIVNKFADS